MSAPTSTFDAQTPVFDILATLPESHELKLKIGEKIKAFMSARRGKDSNIPLPCPGLVSRILDSRSTDPDAWKPGTFNDSAGPKLMAEIAFETVCETVIPSASGAQPSKSGDLIERLNRAVAGVPAAPPDAKASGPAFIRKIAKAIGKNEGEISQIEREYSALTSEPQRAAFASALVGVTSHTVSTEESRAQNIERLKAAIAGAEPSHSQQKPGQSPAQRLLQVIKDDDAARAKAGHAPSPVATAPRIPNQTTAQRIEALKAAMGMPTPSKPVVKPTGPVTLTRAQFDKLDHPARNAHFRSGGKLID